MKRSALCLALLLIVSCTPASPEQTAITQPVPAAPATPEAIAAPEIEVDNLPELPEIPAGAIHNIEIKSFAYNPQTLKVGIGDAVVWTNYDDAPHNIKSSDGVLDSENLMKEESFEATMDTKGTYQYICDIHPSMKGTIVVE